jgi:hypothetical protein
MEKFKHTKKLLNILCILLFAILIAFPSSKIKAVDNIQGSTTIAELQNKKFNKFQEPHFIYKPRNSKYFQNKTKFEYIFNKIILCLVYCIIDFIEFVTKNVWGIIFLIWAFITVSRKFRNNKIQKKFRRENNKYDIKRNEGEGPEKERHSIFLLSKIKNNEGKIVYHHIINTYTMVKLGYARPSRYNDCFNAKDKDYIMGENIIFYNITFDFRKIDNS